MSFIDLEAHAEGLEQIALDLLATDRVIDAALKSTLGKMARWLRTRSVKGLSKELVLQQKVIRKRLRQYRVERKGDSYKIRVWYGLDPIDFIWLKPRQTQKGVRAYGGRFIEDGFIARGSVWKRKGRARLPIERQYADINDKANVYLEDQLFDSPAFEAQLMKTFEHEIAWRMQKQR